MKAASIGMQWSFSAQHVRSTRSTSPDHAAEHAMLADMDAAHARVRLAIERAGADGASIICMAASTLPVLEHAIPEWLLAASRGLTICLETFTGAGTDKRTIPDPTSVNSRRAWVLQDGLVVVGPERQLVVDSKSGARALAALRAELLAGRRTVTLARGVGVLLICGEILLFEGSKRSPEGVSLRNTQASGWWESLPQPVVVLNPTHTPMKLPAIDDKRRWASRRGAVLAPNNSAPAVDRRDERWGWKTDGRTGFAYVRSERLDPRSMLGIGGAMNGAKPSVAYAAVRHGED